MPEFENDFEGTEEASPEAAVDTIAAKMEAMEAETQPSVSVTITQGAPLMDTVIFSVVDEDEEEDAEEASEDDFFAENEAAQIPDVDPATIVTVRTSQGSDVYVPAPAAMPLVDVIAKSGLRFNGDFTCWLNGQEVGLGTVVSGGQTVTVVGSVKGGAC